MRFMVVDNHEKSATISGDFSAALRDKFVAFERDLSEAYVGFITALKTPSIETTRVGGQRLTSSLLFNSSLSAKGANHLPLSSAASLWSAKNARKSCVHHMETRRRSSSGIRSSGTSEFWKLEHAARIIQNQAVPGTGTGKGRGTPPARRAIERSVTSFSSEAENRNQNLLYPLNLCRYGWTT